MTQPITVVGAVWDDVTVQVADWLEEMAALEPQVDVAELTTLRAALETDVTAVLEAAGPDAGEGVVLSKSRLAQLDRCERSAFVATRVVAPPDPISPAALAGRALDHFVAHVLVGGRPGESGHDLRAALVAHGDHEATAQLDAWQHTDEGAELDRRVDALAAAVLDSWRGIGAEWAPRTQTSAALVLADGALRVSGVVDVELGGPHTARPGVVIEVKSGRAVDGHRHETYLYGLLVALRDGVAPAATARWYPGGVPVALPVTIGTLEAAAERLLAGVRRWVDLLAGVEPDVSPGVWCGWCPVRVDCDVAPGTSADPAVPTAAGADQVDFNPEVDGEEPW